MRRIEALFALLCVSFVAACASNEGSVARTPAVVAPSNPPTQTAPVSFVVRIPTGAQSTAANARRPHYLSSGTQSIAVSINRTLVATADTTATSPNCSAVTGAIQCTIATNAAIGSDTFAIVSYDEPGGTGDVLSSGSTTSTIATDAANVVTVTLAGVVASVSMSIPPIPTCTATAVPLTVRALDAAGFTIVGSTPYDTPIALSLANAKNSSATTLTGTTIAKPGDGATIAYDGGYEPGSVITASGTGFSSTYTVFPTPTVCHQYPVATSSFPHIQGIALGSDGNLYVGSENTHQMLRVATSGAAIGAPVPIAITSGPSPNTANPLQAVSGPDGNLWIADGTNAIDEIGIPLVASQNTYGAGTYQESAVAVGPDKRLWFTDIRTRDVEAITTAGVLTAYPIPSPNPSGTPGLGATDPAGIVAGPDGAIWLTQSASSASGSNGGSIARLTTDGTTYTEYPVPIAVAGTRATPQDIVVGGDGNLWFDDRTQDAIGRVTPSGSFTIYPIPDGSSGVVYGMTTGPDGNIWFVGNNDASGAYVGRCTLAGIITQYAIPNTSDLDGPYQVTVSSDDNLWFTQTYGGTSGDGQIGYLVI